MAKPALVDNDIILKICRFGCNGQLSAALGGMPAAILGVARYALRDRVRRSKDIPNLASVAAGLEQIITTLNIVEPEEAEIAAAAALEEEAARRALDLDTGESLLLAILVNRSAPLLLTGDKRAVAAIHRLGVAGAEGRIACLEQLMYSLLRTATVADVRAGVCSDQSADRAISACFVCLANEITEADVQAGLRSYVAHLRSMSGALLIGGDDLSALCQRDSSAGT